MNNKLMPFHLAVPVDDIDKAKAFYGGGMGFSEGRSDTNWIDYDFYGHQFVVHYQARNKESEEASNPVDGHDVPIPHFGVVLAWDDWHVLKDKLLDAGINFIIEPYIRFEGKPGEQATMFFKDPSGNALEFKSFKDLKQLFAK